jgi:hypothetical protein
VSAPKKVSRAIDCVAVEPDRFTASVMPQAVLYAMFSPRPNADECESVEKQHERCRAKSLD